MKKIVLITTGQPSTNPRIVKEADALHAAGYEVTLLYSFFIRWATDKDSLLLQKVPWKYKLVGGSPDNKKKLFFFTRIRNKMAGILNTCVGNNFLFAERTQARAYDELLSAAIQIKADWYIGHNLGALPIAVNAAKFNKAKAGFDFEDYHRGEMLAGEKKLLPRLVYLENKYIPQLNYYSTASPLITATTKKNHLNFKGIVITLLNCFPLTQQPAFREKDAGDSTLQLFWFSQTIGTNRGLETLISALKILNDPAIHLTLAGRCDEEMQQYLNNNAGSLFNNIHFAGIIQPEELPAFAARFDVGMSLELMEPENRNLCLTNKIFTYLLAGNAMVLSATGMQCSFNEKYQVGGMVHLIDVNGLAEKIAFYKSKERLQAQRWHNYTLANKELNWELESQKICKLLMKSYSEA